MPQDYLQAGDMCHKAGIDPQHRLSFYSLGYACTVRGVAGRLIREKLPNGAFRIPTAPAIVEFNLSNSQMRIVSAPTALHAEASTGSHLGAPLVDTQQVVERAWRDAVATVPKPDAAKLDSGSVDLFLDIDATLEAGLHAAPSNQESGGPAHHRISAENAWLYSHFTNSVVSVTPFVTPAV